MGVETGLVWVGLAGVLSVPTAIWLHQGRHRRADDERHQVVPPWAVPWLSVLAAGVASPFFVGQPVVVTATNVAALVWAVTLAVVDLEIRRLPDTLVLPAYPVAGLLLAGCAVAAGEPSTLLRVLACAGAATACFLLVALVSPGGQGMGLGDVKLAGVLGGLLGWWGWSFALLGLLCGVVLGGLGAAVLLVTRRVTLTSSVAYGPSLLLGAYLVTLTAAS